ncbi:FAD-binding domain-containing protein [Rhizobium sp. RU36D]|uniref:FAD-binding domain-containing protein n=1 Tax=Rhizobium sp. RU36D TaxID=1907415 RepID=UPI0009D8DF84|nr:FAD-binding domain-containing protein [Rhizobium sp. RU36D]SMC94498.1 deoxyribodipyrimidine photo-lyase [Rhizobium sp. RU36D]
MDTGANQTHTHILPLTRQAALERLQDFLPKAGPAYARMRNFDGGPNGHGHVSRLSAALRRRLISEEEVVAAALAQHGPIQADKFISEVFWRTYWKGWLEQRPSVWTGYRTAVDRERQRLATDPFLADRYEQAVSGRSGIDCFDAWVAELEATGYLHNWARMQFASIWIFTLGLPWELGAAFMLDRLIDADPASNTLSWRWVAGLHTAGKTYLADAERIRTMTNGRFAPRGLARSALVPADSIILPSPTLPRPATSPDLTLPTLLLLTTEDLSLETVQDLQNLAVRAIAILPGDTTADAIALDDALSRAKQLWPESLLLGAFTPDALAAAQAAGCRQVVTGFIPVGPTADRLPLLRQETEQSGLVFAEHLRGWDSRARPYCRKGFFALKEKIPMLLKSMDHKT